MVGVRAVMAAESHMYGQFVRLNIAVVADGVMLGMTEHMPCEEEFNSDVDALLPAIVLARDDVAFEESVKLKKRIADPRFSAGKVFHSKRLVLARSLFPASTTVTSKSF